MWPIKKILKSETYVGFLKLSEAVFFCSENLNCAQSTFQIFINFSSCFHEPKPSARLGYFLLISVLLFIFYYFAHFVFFFVISVIWSI